MIYVSDKNLSWGLLEFSQIAILVGMKDCVFCKIVKGELPSHRIWEDKKHLAILSIFPNTEGFSIVLTKKHLPSYAFANDDKTLKDLILATKKTALIIDRAFDDVGRTGMFFEGFGVDHLHSRLFPMHGTSDMKKWKPIIGSRKEFYEKYPGYLSSHDYKKADDKILERLAKKIKKVTIKK